MVIYLKFFLFFFLLWGVGRGEWIGLHNLDILGLL